MNVKSKATLRKWIKQLEDFKAVPENSYMYQLGMIVALQSIVYDWGSPIMFLKFAKHLDSKKRKKQ